MCIPAALNTGKLKSEKIYCRVVRQENWRSKKYTVEPLSHIPLPAPTSHHPFMKNLDTPLVIGSNGNDVRLKVCLDDFLKLFWAEKVPSMWLLSEFVDWHEFYLVGFWKCNFVSYFWFCEISSKMSNFRRWPKVRKWVRHILGMEKELYTCDKIC